MAILEEQKVKFFQFLDNILKEKSTALVDGGDLKTKDLKKEGGEDNMAEEKRLEDMEKKLQELSDTFAKDKKAMEDAHKASIAEVEKKLSEENSKKMEETNKKLADAEAKLAERDKDLHTEKVKNTCSALVEKGFWPEVIAKVEKVMFSDVDGKFDLFYLGNNYGPKTFFYKSRTSIFNLFCVKVFIPFSKFSFSISQFFISFFHFSSESFFSTSAIEAL